MEYLSRILGVVSGKGDFHHHPLCGRLKLNHLCFADDLLLFAKGDVQSVRLLLNGFVTFSEASGLVMNQEKSDLYCNGVNQNVLDIILKMSGFKRGTLPFRYLGVPVSSKKISSKECFLLCEKICARIRGWGARKLSYMGRLVLVNAVLNSMHTYWASIFVLPVAVMNRVIAICRNYLWDGGEDYHKAPLVSWEKVCLTKRSGGLGVIHCQKWNIAAVGKYVWWLAAKKDHLWVKWVNHIYLKGVGWMDYKPSSSSSWVWRQICKVRDVLKAGFIGDKWCSGDGVYTIKRGYVWLCGSQPKVYWAHGIWNRFNVPKWSYIAWLARLQRLLTLDRVIRYGVATDGVCYLCGLMQESCSHLMFECRYSSACLGCVRNVSGDQNGEWGMEEFTQKEVFVSASTWGMCGCS